MPSHAGDTPSPPIARLLSLFETLARIPVAPFREQWMCDELDRLLDSIPLVEREVDRFGNRIARVTRGAGARGGYTFVAHVDHPGFTFPLEGGARATAPNLYEATFEGHVTGGYFDGARVRLLRSPDDAGICGTIVQAGARDHATYSRRVTIQTDEPADGAVLGTWNLPVFEINDDLVAARSDAQPKIRFSTGTIRRGPAIAAADAMPPIMAPATPHAAPA